MTASKKKPLNPQIDEALQAAGGFGRWTAFTVLVIVLGNVSGGLFVVGVAYLELEPTYMCRSRLDWYQTSFACTPEEFCD